MSGQALFDSHLPTFTDAEKKTAQMLLEAGQVHLFEKWSEAGSDAAEKSAMLAKAAELDSSYPGGIKAYTGKGKVLLAASARGDNPFEGYSVSEPSSAVRFETPEDFTKWESLGEKEYANTAFVMVAGGLGERLGYNGIKISLPSEITTGKSYIQMYIEHILAFQAQARASTGDDSIKLQLGIMTSADTDKLTRELLESNGNFGLSEDQLTIFKQGKVPSLLNNDAAMAQDGPYALSAKPHGHGDVHMLLYSEGIAERWVNAGVKWICFFQDTNGLVFRAIPGALGVSATNNLVMNSVTVPRRPGEEVGAICSLNRAVTENEESMPMAADITINVEYNQIKALMGETPEPLAPGSDCSVYPGNINVLVFQASPYLKTLAKTEGVITEFVNPKYKPGTNKTVFKKPTRLECMMQDFPKLLSGESAKSVGFSQFPRWTAFSAVKNQIETGIAKQEKKTAPEVAASGESDHYAWSRTVLTAAGVSFEPDAMATYAGITVPDNAKIVLAPGFGTTQDQIKARFTGANKISPRSTLIVDGDVTFNNFTLDGALTIKAAPGSSVKVDGLSITNEGYSFEPIGDADVPESLKIRGYMLKKTQGEVINHTEGVRILSGDAIEEKSAL